MIVWTAQSTDVLESLIRKRVYQADFKKSSYLRNYIPNNETLYRVTLSSFNRINGTDVPGLIYAFTFTNNHRIYDVPTYERFMTELRSAKNSVRTLWRHFIEEQRVLLQIMVEDEFNPMYINYNDYQEIMPPIELMPPYYTEATVNRIIDNFVRGEVEPSPFPSSLMQVHFPQIEASDVLGVFPMFRLDE